jgi:hypothetical protein
MRVNISFGNYPALVVPCTNNSKVRDVIKIAVERFTLAYGRVIIYYK